MNINNTSRIRVASVTAGISLLIMTIAAFFSFAYVHSSIVVIDDGFKTLANLKGQHFLFNAEIFGWFIIIFTDILVSIAFYVFFSSTDKKLSFIGSGLRLIYTSFLLGAVIKLISVSKMIQTPQLTTGPVMDAFKSFDTIWSFGLIIFGFHLLVTGLISIRIKSVPKIISILLIFAGFSYILIHLLNGFAPQLVDFKKVLEMILSLPMMIGELSFGLWLLLKGGKKSKPSI